MKQLLAIAIVFATSLSSIAQEATISELQELLPAIGVKAIEERGAAQQKWEKLCYPLGSPGNNDRAAVCQSMTEMLTAPKTKPAAKQFILKQLERIGGEEVVETLASFLAAEQNGFRDSARRALANNPSPLATKALIERFANAEKDAEKRGLINAIGYRNDNSATDFLARVVNDSKGGVMKSAVFALGRIADRDTKLIRKGGDKDALLNVADQLAASGNEKAAVAIYRPLAKNLKDTPFGTAAFRGMLESSADEQVTEMIIDALSGDHSPRRQIAMARTRSIDTDQAAKIAAALKEMTDDAKATTLTALSTRTAASNTAEIAEHVLAAASSENEQVRLAAIGAMASVGDATALPDLLKWLDGSGEESSAARRVLQKMPDDSLDEKLVKQFQSSGATASRKQIIEILNSRRAVGAMPAFVAAVSDKDAELQKRGFDAISRLGSADEVAAMMPALLAATGKDRDHAEKQLVRMCQRIPERAEPVVAYFNAAADATKSQLMPLLGRIGGESSLATIRKAITSKDANQSTAAVTALANWPNHEVASDLKKIAASSTDSGRTIRALRGLARVCVLGGDDNEKLDYLKFVLTTATRDDEKVLALERAKSIRTVESLNFVLPHVQDSALGDRACRTVIDLAHHRGLREPNRKAFEPALKKVQSLMKDEKQLERVRKYLANE